MKTFISNSVLFIIFASVSYYFDMPWITIVGFGFWVILWMMSDSEENDRRNELIEKINFLLRGSPDHIKDLQQKIEELEREITTLRSELNDKQDKPRDHYDAFDDDFGHLG